MNHLSLFNGTGGFQLAAYWVGWNNVAHVEIDDFCNRLVAKHFPESICFTDIKEFTYEKYKERTDEPIHIISGGEPCQPHSVAGLGKGQADDRYLWPEYFRVIQEFHPVWIINENVDGSISNGILDLKITHLESEGYACQAFVIPASAVGALHQRKRVWLIAYNANYNDENRKSGKLQKKKIKKIISERNKIQHTWQPVDLRFNNSDTNCKRQQKCNNTTKSGVLPEGISRYFGFGDHPHGNFTENEIKSGIIRMLDGLPKGMDYADRNKRIKLLGNAIVPQVAYEIFKIIDQINRN